MKLAKQVTSNIRVEIQPELPGYWHGGWSQEKENDAAMREAKLIVAEVKRHVDGARSARIVFDTKTVCVFCGHEPEVATVASDNNLVGEPFCCDDAVYHWRTNNGHPINFQLVIKEGDTLMAIGEGFKNIQESPVGFGKNRKEALESLKAAIAKATK